MRYTGRVFKFGDDIDTDAIIPARFLNTSDPAELARHVMEDWAPAFASEVKPGDIVIAGRNFGCGSSREHASAALKAVGVSVVIAQTFARIFYRNSFNTGLPILESKEAVNEIEEGDMVEVDIGSGEIKNLTKNKSYHARPIPPFMRELLSDGGLMPYLTKKAKLK